MQMGMIGLGRMGASMVQRLTRGGHECVVYDVDADALARVVKEGARGTSSLEAFAAALKKPRVAWMMVPAAVVEQTVGDLPHSGSNAATSSSTAATRTTSMTFVGRRSWPHTACTMWMPARVAASGASSAASAR